MYKVTVICLCFNQAKYVQEAIDSVYNQDFSFIEVILVNDASSDASAAVIEVLQKKYPSLIVMTNEVNKGMCSSFNAALVKAKGEFIIDLAADDILVPNRISTQYDAFQKLDEKYGVVFSDAFEIDEQKRIKGTFYKRDGQGKLIVPMPDGDVFETVVHSYQICSPTIMVRKTVFISLGGYDESLSYEDYDFFIRSSRDYFYHFIDKPLLFKREVKKSAAKNFYNKGTTNHLHSTLTVVKKALWLCRTDTEKLALLHSVRYHFRQSYFLSEHKLALNYFEVIKLIAPISILDKSIEILARNRISVYVLYLLYRKLRRA